MSPSHPQRQLALNVQLGDDATLDNFLRFPCHGSLLAAIEAQLDPMGEPLLYLAGPADAGKSHLLQAACHRAGARALYLPLSELTAVAAEEILQGLECLDLVCLDDLHTVAGVDAWEYALFQLCNRAREQGCRLLASAAGAPRTLSLGLADLTSRLSWGVVYQLPPLSEQQRLAVLGFRAGRRGLELPSEVAQYIVSRAPRGLGALLELLARLDAASLAEQRRLSIPFVKHALQWQ
jgi:DnaA family protein